MSRPVNLHTRIFLDSGDPDVTREMLHLLGFLDGQTTNPSLVAKKLKQENEQVKLTEKELLAAYKDIVQEISGLIPEGSVSIEVYADHDTESETMLAQGDEMFGWINNAHIKFPTNFEGLKAAAEAIKRHLRVNMTLVFDQEQAAAVHAATKGANKGQVFLSPFIGRLDDKGQNGMDLIAHCLAMYQPKHSHVEVLAASIRSLDHLLGCLHLGVDIITCPPKILREWAERGMPIPGDDFEYFRDDLEHIPFHNYDLDKDWQSYDIEHELTDIGIDKFTDDWNALLSDKS